VRLKTDPQWETGDVAYPEAEHQQAKKCW